MRVSRLAAGSDVILRGYVLFLGSVWGEGVVSARVLMDGAGLVGGTGSIRSAPLLES